MNKRQSKKCAIYTRVSTDNQAEKEFSSCDAQEQKIKSFIASQENWQANEQKTNYWNGLKKECATAD